MGDVLKNMHWPICREVTLGPTRATVWSMKTEILCEHLPTVFIYYALIVLAVAIVVPLQNVHTL